MTRKKQPELIRGHAAHRRTEGDYMAVLLDTVSLEDWRGVVAGALREAKDGNAQARQWLAQYLVGKPAGNAPTPLTVVVQQLNGTDALMDKLARDAYQTLKYPGSDGGLKEQIRALVAAELAQKVTTAETIEHPANPATARLGDELGN